MRFRSFVLLSLLLAGCSKNNEHNDPAGITARINGKPFQAFQSAAGLYANYYQVGGVGTLDGDTVFLTVYLATPIAPDQTISTDDNGFAEIDYVLHKNNAPYATYSARQGQKGPAFYTVTAIDTVKHTIQGTFTGTLLENGFIDGTPDSIVIASGSFNASYR